MQRTVADLVTAIAEKFQVESTAVIRVTHLNSRGLQIIVDEEVVRELPEEQDMIVEFSKIRHPSTFKTETREQTGSEILADGDMGGVGNMYPDGLEMWLNY